MTLSRIVTALGVLVAIAIMYFWLKPDAEWQGVKVITGDSETVTLPDGSSALLTGPAQVGFPKVFDEKIRKVKAQGLVNFDIQVNEKNFIVQTEKGGIETKQAKVKINTSIKDSLIVECYEGFVRMIAKGKKGICEAQLIEGQQGFFYKKNTKIQINSLPQSDSITKE